MNSWFSPQSMSFLTISFQYVSITQSSVTLIVSWADMVLFLFCYSAFVATNPFSFMLYHKAFTAPSVDSSHSFLAISITLL
jgi:hypothetical protein